jgi:hypothetical protein
VVEEPTVEVARRHLLVTLGGRKFAMSLLALAVVLILGLAGRVTWDQALSAIKWVVAFGAGSIAAEDGLRGLGRGG